MKYILTAVLVAQMVMVSAQIENLPEGWEEVSSCKATVVKSQGRTGTCWSFSASSFLESEVLKNQGKHIDISEMFTVRNIYLEKAMKYVRYHGISNFSQGSLAHDVINSYRKYGMMPESAYSGKKGQKVHDHTVMEKELKAFLDTLLKSRMVEPHWKQGFNNILDKHLGSVSLIFEYEGVMYNPKSFAQQILQLDMDDYIGFTSFTHHPFYDDFVVEVPDNFSSGEYQNIPLNEMISVMDKALDEGYTIEWDGDVSEIGFVRKGGYALYTKDTTALKMFPVVPKEDPVSQDLRQVKFDNHETTDDHLMHVTGRVKSAEGKKFYIVKNSWGSRAGFGGYCLMSENYMKMKTVSIMVNKSGVDKALLKKLVD